MYLCPLLSHPSYASAFHVAEPLLQVWGEKKEKMREITIVPGGETPRRQFPIGPSTRKTAQNPFETHSSNTQEQGTGRSPIKLSLSKGTGTNRPITWGRAEGYGLDYREEVPDTSQRAPLQFHRRVTESKSRNDKLPTNMACLACSWVTWPTIYMWLTPRLMIIAYH